MGSINVFITSSYHLEAVTTERFAEEGQVGEESLQGVTGQLFRLRQSLADEWTRQEGELIVGNQLAHL